MSVTTLRQESEREGVGHFYVPRFEVKIEGVGLPRDILRDVIQVTYRDNIKEIDGFELTVNNWDTQTRTFKYVGSEEEADLSGETEDSHRFRIFEPCNKEVQVRMGYLDDLQLMVTGSFTTMEPSFTSSAAPTLTVRGLNILHKLRTQPFTTAWTDKRDSEVAKSLETMRDPRGGPRFPVPIDISTEAQAREPVLDYLAQRNQYDIDFLLQRARQRGYVVYLQPDATGRTNGRLYFGPRDVNHSGGVGMRDVTFRLVWGQSLIEFKPTLTTATQARSVTVHGWNRRTARPITQTVTLDDARIRCNRDIHRLLQQCDPRGEIVVTEPVFTPGEARERALAILNNLQHQFVKCEARTVGLPDLRAGMQVEIDGVGSRFSGRYFVTETTHTLNDSGYVTQFKAQRDDPGRVS